MKMSATTRNADPEKAAWDTDLEARLWAGVEKTDSCWNWTRSGNGSGYGRMSVAGQRVYVHRLSYVMHKGEIPAGLVIDHLCRNPSCVNPDHLEAVTHRENIQRGDAVTNSFQRRKTHCNQGHPFTSENTYIIPSTGARHCRTCRKAWRRR